MDNRERKIAILPLNKRFCHLIYNIQQLIILSLLSKNISEHFNTNILVTPCDITHLPDSLEKKKIHDYTFMA